MSIFFLDGFETHDPTTKNSNLMDVLQYVPNIKDKAIVQQIIESHMKHVHNFHEAALDEYESIAKEGYEQTWEIITQLQAVSDKIRKVRLLVI